MSRVIYGLIDGDTLELRYVGQTISHPEHRLQQHKQMWSPNVHLNNWLAVRPINILVLERDPEDLNEAEIRWIREMRAGGARLLNLTEGGGGGGNTGHHHSEEAKAKIRAALTGRKHSVEAKARMSIAQRGNRGSLGRACSPETRARISAAKLGHKHTAETRANMSAAQMGNKNALGRVPSEETRAKMRAAQAARWARMVR